MYILHRVATKIKFKYKNHIVKPSWHFIIIIFQSYATCETSVLDRKKDDTSVVPFLYVVDI